MHHHIYKHVHTGCQREVHMAMACSRCVCVHVFVVYQTDKCPQYSP